LYVGIAYALSHGLGYAHAHLPGYPAAVHFPPLYPLVLAPFVGLLPLSAAVFAAKVLNIGLGAVAAGLIAWYATRVELLGPGAPGGSAPRSPALPCSARRSAGDCGWRVIAGGSIPGWPRTTGATSRS